MDFQIRSVNTKYKDGEVSGVQVVYSAKTENRSVNVNGNFELSAEEYENNEAIDQLEAMSKEHLLNEINA
ncbi:hypothetical protein ACDX78_10240 [Virgibacillus oceani]